MKLLCVFILIINCLINNKIFAIKCQDLEVGKIYRFQDGTYLYLDREQPQPYDKIIYFPKINSDKDKKLYYISGVMLHGFDILAQFTFNLCIDIDSESSLITNYSFVKEFVGAEILDLSIKEVIGVTDLNYDYLKKFLQNARTEIQSDDLDIVAKTFFPQSPEQLRSEIKRQDDVHDVPEENISPPPPKRPKIETERQTPNYDKPEATPLLSSSELQENKFIFPTDSYVVYKRDNIILMVFPKFNRHEYRGFLIYNKLSLHIPFRGLTFTHDGNIKIRLIKKIIKSPLSYTYFYEGDYYIPQKDLLLVDEKDYEESYKNLIFPEYFSISGCEILNDNVNNGVTQFRLQNNILIKLDKIHANNTQIRTIIYSINGKITIRGKEYQMLTCKTKGIYSIIKYFGEGTGTQKEYSFNILDFII